MRKVVVGIIGGTVLLIGIALLVLPGPAFVVIPAGFAILATEFVWARQAWKKSKEAAEEAQKKGKGWWAELKQRWKAGTLFRNKKSSPTG